MTVPKFITTAVGLAAASIATPIGPFIHIVSFKVGSAFNYDPQASDSDINGFLLYEGVPSTYEYVGDNTLNVVCKIPADAGPFDFGEVAIFLEGGVMFAKAAFQTLQHKYTSLGTNVLSTYTFNCLLRLDQSVAIFKVDTVNGPPPIWEVDKWSDVYPPGLSANPNIPAVLVRELDQNGNSTLIHQASPSQWTVGTNYKLIAEAVIVGATINYVDISKNDLGPFSLSSVNRLYVLEFADGYLRSVSGVTAVGAVYRFALNPELLPAVPTVGAPVRVHSNSFAPLEPVFSFSPTVAPTGTTISLTITNARAYAGATVTVTNTYNTGATNGPFTIGTIDSNGYFSNTSTTLWGSGQVWSVATVFLNGVNFKTFAYVSGDTVAPPGPPATTTVLTLTGDVSGTATLSGGTVTMQAKVGGPMLSFGPTYAPDGTTITTTITGAIEHVGETVTVVNLYHPSGILLGPTTVGVIDGSGNLTSTSITAWSDISKSATFTAFIGGRNVGTFLYTSVPP